MILIAAGSNLPISGLDSQQIVSAAFSVIAQIAHEVAVSPLYETPAWPDPSHPPFINAVGAYERSDLSPAALLAALHAIENGFLRQRRAKNAPRTLDLDLLAYDDVVADGSNAGPILPHPGLETRAFVLAPLCDIAPDWRSPASGRVAREMLAASPMRDVLRVL